MFKTMQKASNHQHVKPEDEQARNGISPEQVSMLVEHFYQRVFESALLGPVFTEQTTEEWHLHLQKMKAFWRSVLLKTGEYKGKPVPAHQRLTGITFEHFEEWLTLFTKTSNEIFSADTAPIVNAAAIRIASSLWLSRSSDPFASPPDWSAMQTQSK